jgi:membrane protein DedA with SNARE-associated domain
MDAKAQRKKDRRNFLLKQFRQGFLYLILIVAVFIVAKKYFNVDYASLLAPTYDMPSVVYGIYTLSEIAFGIIPPEIFFIWASTADPIGDYVFHVFLFSLISYAAGVLGFLIGKRLYNNPFVLSIQRRFLEKYRPLIRIYGTLVVIVAAITPIPFSGISMLVGTVGFSWKKYLLAALVRFGRYFVYALIIWEANQL